MTAQSEEPIPLGMFWDIENYKIPEGKSASGVEKKRKKISYWWGMQTSERVQLCS